MDKSLKDPGLQLERTMISWSRTIYVMLLGMTVFLKKSLQDSNLILIFCSILFLSLIIIAFIRGRHRALFSPVDHQVVTVVSRCSHLVIASITMIIIVLTISYFIFTFFDVTK